jgi:hypothetical protein
VYKHDGASYTKDRVISRGKSAVANDFFGAWVGFDQREDTEYLLVGAQNKVVNAVASGSAFLYSVKEDYAETEVPPGNDVAEAGMLYGYRAAVSGHGRTLFIGSYTYPQTGGKYYSSTV